MARDIYHSLEKCDCSSLVPLEEVSALEGNWVSQTHQGTVDTSHVANEGAEMIPKCVSNNLTELQFIYLIPVRYIRSGGALLHAGIGYQGDSTATRQG